VKDQTTRRSLRSAIYTRVSTEQGLEQDFNSLDAQGEACEAYIKSQAHEGWRLVRGRYDDGGFSGGSMDRPALQKLLIDVEARRIDVIVVYKVDRLTRSLADFFDLVTPQIPAQASRRRQQFLPWRGARSIPWIRVGSDTPRAVAVSNSGNGNLRPETLDRTRRQ
jgi:hypothetical protein